MQRCLEYVERATAFELDRLRAGEHEVALLDGTHVRLRIDERGSLFVESDGHPPMVHCDLTLAAEMGEGR